MLTACIRLQNIINFFDGKRTLAACTKNARHSAKRAKLLFSIVEYYPSLWRAWASKSSSPWLPETESGVKIFFILCFECFLWHLFAGDYWSQLSSCVASLAVSFTNDDFSKFKRKIVVWTCSKNGALDGPSPKRDSLPNKTKAAARTELFS